MEEAQRLCDRVGIIDQGRMVAEGLPDDLISSLGAHHVLEFALAEECDNALLAECRTLPSVESARIENGLFSLSVREPHVTIPALLQLTGKRESELAHLATRRASLEDVFLSLTGRHLHEGLKGPPLA
jgi:ABC-2 type transport system ATP-binding protein